MIHPDINETEYQLTIGTAKIQELKSISHCIEMDRMSSGQQSLST